MKLIIIAIFAILLISVNASKVQKKGIPNTIFVHDRRLLDKKSGRDFSGGIRFGSFNYNDVCPDPTGTLSNIDVDEAPTTGSCFTDDALTNGALSGTIGFICQPNGGSSIIHFGYPNTANGFAIGGSNFGGFVAGSARTGWKWGQVGTPTYTGSSASTFCDPTTDASASCTSTYCGGTCTASCTAPTVTSTGESCTDAGTETTYFIPDTGYTPSNCGSLGHCCNNFAFPSVPPPTCASASVCGTSTFLSCGSCFCLGKLDGSITCGNPGICGGVNGDGCSSDADCPGGFCSTSAVGCCLINQGCASLCSKKRDNSTSSSWGPSTNGGNKFWGKKIF